MFIENTRDFNNLLVQYKETDSVYMIAVPVCHKNHPTQSEISFIFVNFDKFTHIIPFNHTDALCRPIGDLQHLNHKKIYTINKKETYHLTGFDNLVDVTLLEYWNTGVKREFDIYKDTTIQNYFMKYSEKQDLIKSIPIMRFNAGLHKVIQDMKEIVKKYDETDIMSYNNDMFDNFTYLEKNGLKTIDDMVHTEYNPYTSTGRPSNRFGGINFAALNKSDGSREKFISRFGGEGKLVEFDYDAYHLRLIADKIDYKFSKESVHQHFADVFGVTYVDAKSLSFQYLYGFIPDDIAESIEYFGKVKEFTDKMWDIYRDRHFIESDIYRRRIFGKDFNANKLFNYYIQLLETETNMLVIKNLKEMMEKSHYKSKFILYSYDSFLFDFNVDDGIGFLSDVKNVLEMNGHPVKVAWGNNYHELENITEKF